MSIYNRLKFIERWTMHRVDSVIESSKMYRLGGETDSAIRWRKKTGQWPAEAGC